MVTGEDSLLDFRVNADMGNDWLRDHSRESETHSEALENQSAQNEAH